MTFRARRWVRSGARAEKSSMGGVHAPWAHPTRLHSMGVLCRPCRPRGLRLGLWSAHPAPPRWRNFPTWLQLDRDQRDFATGRTAPGAQRGAASPTHLRSPAGGEVRHSSGGVRQIYLSRLRVASPRTGRHGRAARPLAGGTPTFSENSQSTAANNAHSVPPPPTSRLPFAACPTSCTRSVKPPRSRWRTWRARYYAPATAPSSTRSS